MKRALICFTRVPRPGSTKTRLLGMLSPEQCARLHWAFLEDLSGVYGKMDADLFIAHTPDPDWQCLRPVFPMAKDFFPQQGETLGDKMHHAIAHVLSQGYTQVVLTGADLPRMTAVHLESGFAALNQADIAIGPTPDGGYYLIGMKEPHKEVFHVPNYGGATVYGNTLEAIRQAGLSAHAALPCADVDTPEDLCALFREISPASATGKCLHQFLKEGISL